MLVYTIINNFIINETIIQQINKLQFIKDKQINETTKKQ